MCTRQWGRQCVAVEGWRRGSSSTGLQSNMAPSVRQQQGCDAAEADLGSAENGRRSGRPGFTCGSDIWFDANALAAMWLLAKWSLNRLFVPLWNPCAMWGILIQKALNLVATEEGFRCFCCVIQRLHASWILKLMCRAPSSGQTPWQQGVTDDGRTGKTLCCSCFDSATVSITRFILKHFWEWQGALWSFQQLSRCDVTAAAPALWWDIRAPVTS